MSGPSPLALARAHPIRWAMHASGGRWQPSRHLLYLADYLMRLWKGDIRRLAISMPPRHGKSELVSKYLPSWILGRAPTSKVIICSYGQDLTAEWSRAARDAFAEHAPKVFGVDTWSRASFKAWDVFRDGVRTGGGLRAVGKGGALTGRGADWINCDDLIRDSMEAGNPTLRQQAWEWFQSVLLTRLEPGGRAVVIQTRWHHDDIIGRLQQGTARGTLGEPWTFVNLPALAEDGDPLGRAPGEALWPARFPVAELEKIRADVGPYVWSALYQGHPTPTSGGMFKRSWLRYYDHEPGEMLKADGVSRTAWDLRRFATVDLATSKRTSADWTVIAVWAYDPGQRRAFLVDLVRERVEGPDLVPLLANTTKRWGLHAVYVERFGFSLGVIQEARRQGLPVREIRPEGDKIARALPLTAALEGGRILLRAGAPWLGALEDELLTFPAGSHDDQVDALAYGSHVVATLSAGIGAVHRRIEDEKDKDERGGPWRIGR